MTPTTTIATLPQMELRIAEKKIREQWKAIDDREAAETAAIRAEFAPVIAEAEAALEGARAAFAEAKKPLNDAIAAIEAACTAERDEIPGSDLAVTIDDDGLPLLCAASGIVILDDDETVVDETTGEVFLRAALGIGARPVADETATDAGDDSESAIDEAAA